MERPRICAAIVDNDLEAVKEIEPLVDLFEVRIDLAGEGWSELVRRLEKPWIACNRVSDEGGSWKGNKEARIEELLKAVELGASIVDVELMTKNLDNTVKLIRKRAKCLPTTLRSQAVEPNPSEQARASIPKWKWQGPLLCRNSKESLSLLAIA